MLLQNFRILLPDILEDIISKDDVTISIKTHSRGITIITIVRDSGSKVYQKTFNNYGAALEYLSRVKFKFDEGK